MTPKLTTSQTVTLIAAAVSLTCACGIGYHNPSPPPLPPPPVTALSVYPASLTFPDTPNLTQSQSLRLTVTNEYYEPVAVSHGMTAADYKTFPIAADHCLDVVLAPQQTCTIDLLYSPRKVGPAQGTMWIFMRNGSSIPIHIEATSVAPTPAP